MEPAEHRFKVSEGDWTCSDLHCGNINFARRNKCNRCDRDRAEGPVPVKKKLGQEIGKVLADKSRGLFSADDWQCIKCGNVNWARRQQCNMCNAPKFSEVEERTGYGGGYNDRGIVEYIQREDSDSEYDEFGRRKKKKDQKDSEGTYDKKNNSENSDNDKDKVNSIREEEKEEEEKEEEEEEEEEDDEDEDDLSKYDLSDWGVTDGDNDDIAQEEKDLSSRIDHAESRSSNKNRRSRSRSPSWKRT